MKKFLLVLRKLERSDSEEYSECSSHIVPGMVKKRIGHACVGHIFP